MQQMQASRLEWQQLQHEQVAMEVWNVQQSHEASEQQQLLAVVVAADADVAVRNESDAQS